jgi:hypothetical protein
MLSAELAKLRDTFEAWGRGDPYPTPETWWQFQSDLRDLVKKLALQDVGVDLTLINVLIQSREPNSNVVFLPHARARRADDIGSSA